MGQGPKGVVPSIDQKAISRERLQVFQVLREHGVDGYVSVKTIAAKGGLSEEAVRHQVKRLRQFGVAQNLRLFQGYTYRLRPVSELSVKSRLIREDLEAALEASGMTRRSRRPAKPAPVV